jgi:hypothetical protein
MTSTVRYPHFGSTTFSNNRLIVVQSWPKCKSLKYPKSSPVGAHKSPMGEAGRGKFLGLKENLSGFNTASSLSIPNEKPHGKNRAKWALCAIIPKTFPTSSTSCWWRHRLNTRPFSRGWPQQHFQKETQLPSCSQKEVRCSNCTPILSQGKCSQMYYQDQNVLKRSKADLNALHAVAYGGLYPTATPQVQHTGVS